MIVVAHVKVVAGKEQVFETLMADLVHMVRRDEPGVIFYHLCKGSTPGTYAIIERYESKAAFETHSQTPYFLSTFAKLKDVVAGQPEIEVLTELE